MRFDLHLTRAKLKVFSAIFSNFVVVWLAAMLGTRDPFVLTLNFLFAIVSLDLAIKAEERAEKI